jgi:hypothetical protein
MLLLMNLFRLRRVINGHGTSLVCPLTYFPSKKVPSASFSAFLTKFFGLKTHCDGSHNILKVN